ncbi:uncharacterized protein PpBr36_10605 [Pyricularia pennisetigena]|uniref:uncharacterized protein n=1 Tax=Pyricularia pennisetigena TaxID=1578925 RepID=UPI001154669C|nr:uncharacterized protein PpBr36_10605 [Pyricularia pennisetigena]TLS21096.1 hypothetical protein PpBr36_10605 [Pyricularia pennisetigena]
MTLVHGALCYAAVKGLARTDVTHKSLDIDILDPSGVFGLHITAQYPAYYGSQVAVSHVSSTCNILDHRAGSFIVSIHFPKTAVGALQLLQPAECGDAVDAVEDCFSRGVVGQDGKKEKREGGSCYVGAARVSGLRAPGSKVPAVILVRR